MSKRHNPPQARPVPILDHPLDAPTAFRPEDLVESVRIQRGQSGEALPEICVLEFDGDLTDKLLARGQLTRCDACRCRKQPAAGSWKTHRA